MGTLTNLEGVKANEIEAVFINKPSDIRAILRQGKGATTAKSNGAINIWRDDAGMIRCNAMRWLQSVDHQTYRTLKEAELWVRKWLKEIE